MFSPSAGVVASAATALGWSGMPVPIRLCGERVWAIAARVAPEDAEEWDYPVSVSGVLVAGTARSDPTPRASLFAGFCPRAVLVPEGSDLLAIRLNAALLDQGVVTVASDGSTSLLSPAGPIVAVHADGDVRSRRGGGDPDRTYVSGHGRCRLLEQAHRALLTAQSM